MERKIAKIKERPTANLSDLSLVSSEMRQVTGGIRATINWKGWFDGSLFRERKFNEFDKIKTSKR